jgi:hypothetical protein
MTARIRIGESKHMKMALMKMTGYEIESTMDDLRNIQSIADKFSDILDEEQKFRNRKTQECQ